MALYQKPFIEASSSMISRATTTSRVPSLLEQAFRLFPFLVLLYRAYHDSTHVGIIARGRLNYSHHLIS